LAAALSREGVVRGYSTLRAATELVTQLACARGKGRLEDSPRQLTKPKWLVVDQLG
jgi:hypothetical protein